MPSENKYSRQLSQAEIAQGIHRRVVGGFWDELGQLQFDFMVAQGLEPRHRLLDVGCGCLRGGLHFIRYLERGHYFGLDMNPTLLEAGRQELSSAGLLDKAPTLLEDAAFDVDRLGTKFDFAIAVSLFTHLHDNHIVRCLSRVAGVLRPGGSLFATFFEAPGAAHLDPIRHEPGGIVTQYDRDPFHQSFEEISFMARISGLRVETAAGWRHPRAQRMFRFFLPDDDTKGQ